MLQKLKQTMFRLLNYLKNWFLRYTSCTSLEINTHIVEDEEPIVRIVFHPLMASESKQKLKREAFLPPPGRQDTSVLRLNYTNADFCKSHHRSVNINGHSYSGLALIKAASVRNNEQLEKPVNVDVIATPLPLLEMHADIFWHDYISERGVPAPASVRKKAEKLVSLSKYFHDPLPNEIPWLGEALSIE